MLYFSFSQFSAFSYAALASYLHVLGDTLIWHSPDRGLGYETTNEWSLLCFASSIWMCSEGMQHKWGYVNQLKKPVIQEVWSTRPRQVFQIRRSKLQAKEVNSSNDQFVKGQMFRMEMDKKRDLSCENGRCAWLEAASLQFENIPLLSTVRKHRDGHFFLQQNKLRQPEKWEIRLVRFEHTREPKECSIWIIFPPPCSGFRWICAN